MKKTALVSSGAALALLAVPGLGQSISIRYAGSVVPGPIPPDTPLNAVGAPDGSLSSYNTLGASATYAGFDCPDGYDEAALAATLGVTPATLSQADFIAFEFNGANGLGFESSTWTFSDSASTEVKQVFNLAPGDELATGAVGRVKYRTFFGGASPHGGEWPFVMFDLQNVRVGDPLFQVQVTTGAISPETPDLDFMGSFSHDPAVSQVRNGTGVNPNGFLELTPAALGTSWTLSVDIVTPGAVGSVVAATLAGPTQGTILAGTVHGELLCLPPYLPLNISLTGTHSIPIPNNCGLLGTLLCAQAATLKPGDIQLQNAIDVSLGAY